MLKAKKIRIAFALIVVALAVFFVLNSKPATINIAGQNIKIDIARTNAEKEQGLSGRVSLAEDSGMLFVFDKSGKYSFWMKDMNFPIDMIWLDQDLKVVYIQENATPESYPESFGPNENANYVLEVVAGFSEKNNLKVGDKAELSL